MTDAKMIMVATEDASFAGLVEVKSVILDGGYLYDEEALSSADLFRKVAQEYPDLCIATDRRAALLKRLGYQSLGYRVKIDGQKKMFWTRRPMSIEAIKAKWPTKTAENTVFPIVGA